MWITVGSLTGNVPLVGERREGNGGGVVTSFFFGLTGSNKVSNMNTLVES